MGEAVNIYRVALCAQSNATTGLFFQCVDTYTELIIERLALPLEYKGDIEVGRIDAKRIIDYLSDFSHNKSTT